MSKRKRKRKKGCKIVARRSREDFVKMASWTGEKAAVEAERWKVLEEATGNKMQEEQRRNEIDWGLSVENDAIFL